MDAARNLEGDVTVNRFSVNQTDLGPLSAHFIWEATNLQFTAVQLRLPDGSLKARGNVNLSASSPGVRFTATAAGFHWAVGW